MCTHLFQHVPVTDEQLERLIAVHNVESCETSMAMARELRSYRALTRGEPHKDGVVCPDCHEIVASIADPKGHQRSCSEVVRYLVKAAVAEQLPKILAQEKAYVSESGSDVRRALVESEHKEHCAMTLAARGGANPYSVSCTCHVPETDLQFMARTLSLLRSVRSDLLGIEPGHQTIEGKLATANVVAALGAVIDLMRARV